MIFLFLMHHINVASEAQTRQFPINTATHTQRNSGSSIEYLHTPDILPHLKHFFVMLVVCTHIYGNIIMCVAIQMSTDI